MFNKIVLRTLVYRFVIHSKNSSIKSVILITIRKIDVTWKNGKDSAIKLN
jgi:hypothetical protein